MNTDTMQTNYDLIVIGGGPAGMAAALAAWKNGVTSILIIERDIELGGVLNQCIHNGFGVHHFKEELTGPEYAARVSSELKEAGIQVLLDTMVLKLTQDKVVHAVSSKYGYLMLPAKAVVLAMGCRERTRGQIQVQGSRPAGVFTAGTAQRLINMEGLIPGKEVVILGSGDIGLIMARRLTLEGAKVKMVVEILPHSNGLPRNIAQCLDDFDIPLFLSHTVLKVHGKKRVTGITLAQVDDKWQPVPGSEREVACDTLLLAVGLIPENEISEKAGIAIDNVTRGPKVDALRQTSMDGVFACGNVLQVHDVVDFVSHEGEIAGRGVAEYLQGKFKIGKTIATVAGAGISYVVPQKLNLEEVNEDLYLYLRVKNVVNGGEIAVKYGEVVLGRKRAARFLPAEMISIKLDAKKLCECANNAIVVEVI